MSLPCCSVTYGNHDIDFKVEFVARKTLEIAVQPDSRVLIKAPLGTSFEEVRKRVVKRAWWIKRQQDYFQQFKPRTPVRCYVGGETHLYLGRRYRLKIGRGDCCGVKLIRGHFHVGIPESAGSDKVKEILDRWYARKATEKFTESFNRCWHGLAKNSGTKPRLQVRRMKKRWGSLSRGGTLTVNTDLIRAPRECIDYVITHELCHVQFHNHSPAFYDLLEKVMPDWERRKQKLELALV
ncbi:M48 family metallopeptidase [Geobacter hydrogenophilus]|uniref:Metal-dependent hydrolase n=1 Tax=Geobacter hydrogenophilus TaxID=40983 RepID=A0A9W6G1H6_9BACT|nr:SprT family zinc-dependent metalloprotease [Geobacter hydrogenophilus]MBT0892830.1 M48 family metallopeptidase [Geobacter hydrogenophilus]GLI38694.1 metal-dependent hydrolase [Geobacter hydrogenophilus]